MKDLMNGIASEYRDQEEQSTETLRWTCSRLSNEKLADHNQPDEEAAARQI
jgi:hypothetical protein